MSAAKIPLAPPKQCSGNVQANEMDIDDLTPEQQDLLRRIQARRKVVVREHRLKKGAGNNQAIVPRRNDPRRISNTQTMKVTCSSVSDGSD